MFLSAHGKFWIDHYTVKEDISMDKPFELKICSAFFCRRSRERLYYELTSKKRDEFFRKMSHIAENYLGDCIAEKYSSLPDIESILLFLNDERCYFISEFK